MPKFRRVFSSTVGTKLLIGLTGLALFAYLILHLAGNVLIFFGQDVFNEYSHLLISNPLIVPIEIGRSYAARARSLGDEVRFIPLEGAGHFELIDPRTVEFAAVLAAVRGLIA